MKTLFITLASGRCAGVGALFWMLACAFPVLAVDPPPSARDFEKLTTRDMTYTRVTVLDVSKTHVFFRSAQGAATVRIQDLDPGVVARLRGEKVVLAADESPSTAAKDQNKRTLRAKAREFTQSEDTEECEDEAECDTPMVWNARSIAGVSVLGIGALALFIGHIWLICAGFNTSALWGICLIIGGFVLDIMFCVGHWEVAKRPVYLQLLGIGVLVGGWKIMFP